MRSGSAHYVVTVPLTAALMIVVCATTGILRLLTQQSLPYPNSHQLWALTVDSTNEQGITYPGNNGALYKEWQKAYPELKFALSAHGDSILRTELVDREVGVSYVDRWYFDLLDAKVSAGATFGQLEATRMFDRIAVVSERVATEIFGDSEQAVGKNISLGSVKYEVIGVLKEGFRSPDMLRGLREEVWLPINRSANFTSWRQFQSRLSVFFRAGSDGHSIEELRAGLSALTTSLINAHREGDAQTQSVTSLRLESLQKSIVGDSYRAGIALFIAALLLLSLALTAVGISTLALYRRRQAIVITKVVLGAKRKFLLQEALTESALSTLVAVVFAILVLPAALGGVRIMASSYLPRISELSLDGTVLGALLVCAFFYCALQLAIATLVMWSTVKHDMVANFALSVRADYSSLLRKILFGLQISLISVVFALGALTLWQSANRLYAKTGFEEGNLRFLHVVIPRQKSSPEYLRSMVSNIEASIKSRDESALIALADYPPVTPGFGIDQVSLLDGTTLGDVEQIGVTTGYFNLLQIPLLGGRTLAESTPANSNELVISHSLAVALGGTTSAVGKNVRLGTRTYEVVGIVGDVLNPTQANMGARNRAYSSFMFNPGRVDLGFLVSGDAGRLEPTVVSKLIGILDSEQFVRTYEPLVEMKRRFLAEERLKLQMTIIVVILVIVSAFVAIRGSIVDAFTIAAPSMAIRLSLGARRRHLLDVLVTPIKLPALVGLTICALALIVFFKAISGAMTVSTDAYILVGVVSVITIACFFIAIVVLTSRKLFKEASEEFVAILAK